MDGPDIDKQSTAAEPSTATTSVAADVNVPDPAEDDLDDLDDLLDDFSSSKITTGEQSGPPAHTPQQNISSDHHGSSPATTDGFTRQLEAQMAALMGDGEETPEMRKEIQAVLQELGAAVETEPASIPQTSDIGQAFPAAAADESFQDAILRTVQRMQDSGNIANVEAAAGEGSDDILAQMLEEMQNGDSSASAGEPEFSKMLMTMMEQLTNKDILYDPMKELNDKFPDWMSDHKASVEADDLLRYQRQQRLITEIVCKFEESTYSDANAKDREHIVKLMQEMQAAGSPPADLVGDMSGAQTALQDLDSNCPQQ
ncbi:MAG: hypothetical protein LQ349_001508 [Xanthoria aureola]|nr:MAG: hypothetical protein LQ349_001508 [Xanthoria aureola]